MIETTEHELIISLRDNIRNSRNSSGTLETLRIADREFNFEFNFRNILTKVGITTQDKNNNLICPYIVEFSNCIFSQNANFSYTNFNQVVGFTDVVFKKNVIIEDTNFNGNTLFESVKFENSEDKNNKRLFENVNIKIMTCCNSHMRNITFEKCNFEELNVYKLGDDINNFLYPTEWDTVNFTHCEFNKLLLGKSIIRDCLFNKSKIIEEADFYKHPLPENINNVLDISTIIDNTTFIEVDFQKEGDFKTVAFKNQVEFTRCRFGDRGAFWKSSFDTLTFENIRLEDKSHIYFGETKGTILQLVSSVLLGRIDFNNDDIKKLNLFGSVVRGTLNRIKFNTFDCENKETACVLKHEETQKSNIIESLKYHAEEKTLHMIDLKKDNKLVECLALSLSKIVNNHGQDLGMAILFTLWVWVFPFTVFSLPNDLLLPVYILGITLGIFLFCFRKIFSERIILILFYIFSLAILAIASMLFWGEGSFDFWIYVKGLIEYFVPTNYGSLTQYYVTNEFIDWRVRAGGIGVYMLGKIFVPYGVFEIIKAFRKYK